jgi:hypothetical protein
MSPTGTSINATEGMKYPKRYENIRALLDKLTEEEKSNAYFQ